MPLKLMGVKVENIKWTKLLISRIETIMFLRCTSFDNYGLFDRRHRRVQIIFVNLSTRHNKPIESIRIRFLYTEINRRNFICLSLLACFSELACCYHTGVVTIWLPTYVLSVCSTDLIHKMLNSSRVYGC